jgi:hypothetical protein
MTVEKHKKEMQQKVKEMMKSIKTIKGEQYAEIVDFLSMCVHLTKMVAVLSKGQRQEVIDGMGEHLTLTLDTAATLIFQGHKISEEDQDEIMTWVEKISDQVDFGLYQVVKDRK